MKLSGKLMAIGLAIAIAAATGAVATAAPAEAQVYRGAGVVNADYYQVGYRGDHGYRDRGNWRGGYREGWRGDGWRGNRWQGGYRGGYGWRGGYREHCWMERGRWGRPIRICR
ncbi:MAG TPA: hypothetical protein VF503_11215 [Sphingobium sp.]|uniref:hypothetical protein n=1 Tax=Sphingobium sp. TaxID=1912891 RepID=UPI002ED1DD0B